MSFDNGINGDEIIAANFGTKNADAAKHDSEDAMSGELDFKVDKDRLNEVSPVNN